ncbi:MAG: TRAP transporter small permease [Halomonadaceae bacterium]|uniref:TRAP transporter small permease protein n=1 Tax=Halomonas colorata TaxID=2742615 RepID=A0ABR9G370_9GAMM|nr:TRAP transporter small permease subunit [Halomonas colorata]MBE0465339.1 TRAP transporter small permease subunit [Halomonas colorata]
MIIFKCIDWLLDRVITPIVSIIGVFVALAFVVGIIARSYLGIAFFGMEELILIAVIWFYMLGAMLASKEGAHLQADFIPVIVKNEKVVVIFRIAATVISILMAGLFISWSNELFQWALKRNQTTPVFSIPIYVSQASLLIAAVFMTLYLVRDLVNEIRTLSCHKKSSTPAKR